MKKTWTTRILIALLTLAMVAGVFGAAPKAALAELDAASIAPAGDKTVGVGEKFVLTGGYANAGSTAVEPFTYSWSSSNDLVVTPATANTRSVEFTAVGVGSAVITFKIKDSDTTTLTERTASINVTVSAFTVADTTAVVGGPATLTPSNGSISKLEYTGSAADYVSISGTSITGVSEGTAIIKATSSNNQTYNFNVVVSKATTVLDASASPSSAAAGETVTLTATSNSPAQVNWTVGSTSIGSGTSITYTIPAGTTSSITATATQAAVDKRYTAATKDVSIGHTDSNPNLSVSPASKTMKWGDSATTFTASTLNTSDSFKPTWTASPAGFGTLTPASNGLSATFQPNATGTGSQTITITVNQAGGNGYRAATAQSASVTIAPQFDLTTTSITTKVGYTGTTFGVTTGSNATVTATSNNTKVATVSPATSTGSGHVFTVSPVAAGDTTITVTDGATTKSVSVHVQSQYPVITAQFWSSDNCTTNLNKTYNWGTLRITVKDYNPSNPYVTVTRSNIRTYIQSGTNSHPSTYTYTAYLTQSGTDGVVDLYVIPQYNGTTYYSVAYSGATTVNSPTIYVSGYTTLPQTGPDYTWAYVLGGLCLITAATAVTLNVRKKKREEI